jgi:hypothetical protein
VVRTERRFLRACSFCFQLLTHELDREVGLLRVDELEPQLMTVPSQEGEQLARLPHPFHKALFLLAQLLRGHPSPDPHGLLRP